MRTSKYLRMGQACALLGVQPHNLRYWQELLGLNVRKSLSGHRLYSVADIDALRRYAELRRAGWEPKACQRWLKDHKTETEAEAQIRAWGKKRMPSKGH